MTIHREIKEMSFEKKKNVQNSQLDNWNEYHNVAEHLEFATFQIRKLSFYMMKNIFLHLISK